MSNLGSPDRLIRALVGIVLVVVPFVFWAAVGAIAGMLSALVGFVLLATALFGFCPIYALFGLSSKRTSVR
jgi:Inner membrane protein YgaP-like, transmembrane domain